MMKMGQKPAQLTDGGTCTMSQESTPWVLHREHLVPIYDTFLEDYEAAGLVRFTEENGSMVSQQNKKITKGDAASVETPLGIANFHVHPFSCYVNENVVWGWPSGEDLRQVIIFALGGNLVHIVFTVEGVYVMEVNPCFLVFLRKLSSKDRAYMIAWIELMGKATHELRGVEANRKRRIRPSDWIKFVNGLRIGQTGTDQCGVIKCNKVTVFSENELCYQALKDYINEYYEGEAELNHVDKKGVYKYSEKVTGDEFEESLHTIKKGSFQCGKKLMNRKNGTKLRWETGAIFNVRLIKHNEYKEKQTVQQRFKWINDTYKEGKRLSNDKTKTALPLLTPPSAMPIVYFPTMSKSCTMKNISKHNSQ